MISFTTSRCRAVFFALCSLSAITSCRAQRRWTATLPPSLVAPAAQPPREHWRFDPRRTQPLPTVDPDDTVVIEHGPSDARFTSGPWRFELDSGGALHAGQVLAPSGWAAAWRHGDHWLFLTRDGVLARGSRFLSPPTVLGEMSSVWRVARVDRDRFAIDVNGSLWGLDDEGPALLLEASTDPVTMVTNTDRGAIFAQRRSGRWQRRDPSGLFWQSIGWTRELGAAMQRLDPDRVWVRSLPNSALEDPATRCREGGECVQPVPIERPMSVDERWARALLDATIETLDLRPRLRVQPPASDLEWLRQRGPATIDARSVFFASGRVALSHRNGDEYCAWWEAGGARCLLAPTLSILRGADPAQAIRERDRCLWVPTSVQLEPWDAPSIAYLVVLCEDGASRLERLPRGAQGFEMFDQRRGVAWGSSLEFVWRTRDGGASWRRALQPFVRPTTTVRTLPVADPSQGVLFRDGFWLSAEQTEPQPRDVLAHSVAPSTSDLVSPGAGAAANAR